MGVLKSCRDSLGILICPCCKIVGWLPVKAATWVGPAHSECWQVAEVETHGWISLWSAWVRLEVSTGTWSPSPGLQVLQAPRICAACWLWPGSQSFCLVFCPLGPPG